MKPSLFFIACLSTFALGFGTAAADAETWVIDTSHSSAQFEVSHLMVATVEGSFSDVKGTVVLDDKNLKASKIEAEIGVASVNSGDKKRDKHLLSADFFDAKKHPKMVFKSTKITKAGKGYKVQGKLTMRGTTKPVTLKVSKVSKPVMHPMAKVPARGAEASTTINRQKFGVKWNKSLDKGGLMVGNDIDITIKLELHKKK